MYKGKRILIHPYGKYGSLRYSVIVWGKGKHILKAKHGFTSEAKALEYKKKLRGR